MVQSDYSVSSLSEKESKERERAGQYYNIYENLKNFTLAFSLDTLLMKSFSLAIVSAVKFSMMFADQDLEHQIQFADMLNAKNSQSQVSQRQDVS